MSSKNLITIVASICLTMLFACTERKNFVIEGTYDCDDGICEVVAYTNAEPVVAPIMNGKFSLTLPLQDNEYLKNLEEVFGGMDEYFSKKNVKGSIVRIAFRVDAFKF